MGDLCRPDRWRWWLKGAFGELGMLVFGLSFGDRGDILIPVRVAGIVCASLWLLHGMN